MKTNLELDCEKVPGWICKEKQQIIIIIITIKVIEKVGVVILSNALS